MQTLTDIVKNLAITAKQTLYLRRVEDCSPFLARLLAKDADFLADSLKHLHISYGLAEMQQFLTAQKIEDAGFKFKYPEITAALKEIYA